jgi:predicted ATP-binding protein involved in virulence
MSKIYLLIIEVGLLIDFNPNLQIGQEITNSKLMEIFRCGDRGGMRRSLKTNTLVLITNERSNEYYNSWKEDELWHYQGMGSDGNQHLEYMQNKTLAISNEKGIKLHLFKRIEKGPYVYLGKVLLASNPYYKEIKGVSKVRKFLFFPLIEVGREVNVTDFLVDIPKEELINNEIFDHNHAFTNRTPEQLIYLMNKYDVDTLTSNGSWFLTRNGYFYNEYSFGEKSGKINNLINQNKIQIKDVYRLQDRFINPFFLESYSYSNNLRKLEKKNLTQKNIRIKSLSYNNELINEPVTLGSFSRQENSKNFYTSLLIGPNGTGKSVILSMIQKIFLDAYLLKNSKLSKLPKEIDYSLIYHVGSDTYQINQINGKISFVCNDNIVAIHEIFLPEKIISCAFTLQDRFSILKENDVHQYEYFGIRNLNFHSSISDISQIVATNIMLASLTDNKLLDNLKSMTKFLGFDSKIRVVFTSTENKKIDEVINKRLIIEKQKEMTDLELVYAEDIDKLINETIKVNLLSLFAPVDNDETIYINNDKLIINFDLNSTEKYETLYDVFKSILHLVDLGLLVSPVIMVSKAKKWFEIDKASSGEFQYLSTMINILVTLKPNSIVLMDEPETSLHPTWQQQYMSQLLTIFKNFSSCHFIIATHSHFMVSDLQTESSSIVTLTRDEENNVAVKLLDENTYGRSAEDILYNIFNLKTVRNYYIENDLAELLRHISNNSNEIDKVENIINRLEKLHLPEEDPINTILLSARGYINNA